MFWIWKLWMHTEASVHIYHIRQFSKASSNKFNVIALCILEERCRRSAISSLLYTKWTNMLYTGYCTWYFFVRLYVSQTIEAAGRIQTLIKDLQGLAGEFEHLTAIDSLIFTFLKLYILPCLNLVTLLLPNCYDKPWSSRCA